VKIRIHRTIILPVVLFSVLFFSVTKGRAQTEGENKVLRKIFELKRDEVKGGCRTVHNEELHNLYSLPGVIV
jgi:hypothetical protein